MQKWVCSPVAKAGIGPCDGKHGAYRYIDIGRTHRRAGPKILRAESWELTDEFVTQHQVTALMVTHNLRYAVEYGTRLLMMDKGQIIIDKSGEGKTVHHH